uniref:Cell wall hydroxyproline-rich glycoprotein n=1 Tax=Cannabis sativa TaxID=3483 RepID=A0A803QJH0_CANSA
MEGDDSNNNNNPRLHQAFIALQAWKKVIYSDPSNFTTNWKGPLVCNYTGIYCAPSLDNPHLRVVAGIDLNQGDIAGFIPEEFGLLTDLALIHLNSNRFCGIIPQTFSNLTLLFELDLSNNRFVGPFPTVLLTLPTLNFLDIRFNEFEGPLPSQLFLKKLDAVFVNNNRFTSLNFPQSMTNGSGTASVLVFANNNYGSGKTFTIPPSIVSFANSLEEFLLSNTNLSGCLPQEVGFLYKLKLFDVSNNQIVGPIPYSMAGLFHLEQLNLAHNKMEGLVPPGICMLPKLQNFTLSYNFFCEEDEICRNLSSNDKNKGKRVVFDDRRNCIPERRFQRSEKECSAVVEHPYECHDLDDQVKHYGFGGAGVGPAFAPVPAPVPSLLKGVRTVTIGCRGGDDGEERLLDIDNFSGESVTASGGERSQDCERRPPTAEASGHLHRGRANMVWVEEWCRRQSGEGQSSICLGLDKKRGSQGQGVWFDDIDR